MAFVGAEKFSEIYITLHYDVTKQEIILDNDFVRPIGQCVVNTGWKLETHRKAEWRSKISVPLVLLL